MKSILGIAVALAAVITLASTPVLLQIRAQTATQLPVIPPAEPATGDHLPVHTVQDDDHIVTVVTKHGEAPTGPIVIIPPEPGKPGNGTIITPGGNVTVPAGNETGNQGQNPGNITVIEPGGKVTEIPGNITNVGNDTIVIAPPDRNITEVPISPAENITVIGPPHPEHPIVLPNETNAGQPCTCNNQSATIPPVLITPAPGQNVTTNPPVVEQPGGAHGNETFPANNATSPTTPPESNPPAATGSNQTSNTGGNETQTTPANNNTNTEPPHATQLPASVIQSSPFLPGYNIHNIAAAYNGVNNQYLNK